MAEAPASGTIGAGRGTRGDSARPGDGAAGPADSPRPSRRRPWWVWAVPFAGVLAVLLARNAFLFTTPLYETADVGADSILIEQARRFSLFVGNYSREHFNHPGPAFLYVQSFGETVFWSWLHAVPTAWNGQLIAMYALNALFAAFVVGVGYGWGGSARGGLAALLAVLALAAVHPAVFSTDWMPYIYVPAYLAFLVAIASVAAGRTADLWIAAVAGWFCVHGHACFLFFVPGLTACAVIALAWPRRRRLGPALRSFFARRRRAWVPAAVISALFLLPVAAELVRHGPGNYLKYFGYGTSAKAGGHTAGQVLGYVAWYWGPSLGWLLALAALAVACAATWWCPAGRVRRLCVSLLAFNVVSTLLTLFYTAVGVDSLSRYYMEYFYWSAPAVMVLVVALALSEAARGHARAATAALGVAALAAGVAFAAAGQSRTSTLWVEPALPHKTERATDASMAEGVSHLAALAHGKTVVMQVDHNAWPTATGLFVQAERAGVPMCVVNSYWAFMMTRQFICTPREQAEGKTFYLWQYASIPAHVPWAFRFNWTVATTEKGDGVLKT